MFSWPEFSSSASIKSSAHMKFKAGSELAAILGVAFLLTTCSLSKAYAQQIVAEYPIGTMVAGRDEKNRTPIYEQIIAAVMLPTPENERLRYVENCSRNALGAWASRYTSELDDEGSGAYPKPRFARIDTTIIDLARAVDQNNSATALTPALVEKTRTERVLAIDAWLRAQVSVMREELKKRCGTGDAPDHAVSQMKLLLSMRRCPLPVPTQDYHPCNMKGLEGTGKVVLRERAYAQLYFWMQSQGAKPANVWIDLTQGSAGQIIALNYPATSRLVVWPVISAEAKISQFERQVAYLRSLPDNSDERKSGLSPALPKAIGLSQETAARVIDLIESPIHALEGLPSQAQSLALISDEVARTRITECVRLRRVAIDQPSAIAKCSGYNADIEQIRDCLNKQRCLPPISAQALAGVVRIVDRLDLKDLASQTQLPRLGSLEYDAYKIAASVCAKGKSAIAVDEAYQQAAMDCLLSQGMSAAELETYKCAKDVVDGVSANLVRCIPGASAEFQVASECWSKHQNDFQAALWCSGKSSVNPAVSDCIQEFVDGGSQGNALSTCLAAQLGQDPKVAAILACTTKYSSDREAAALCMVSPDLPPDLSVVATCGVSATSWESFATCAAKEKLPDVLGGDAGKIVACGMQSGGSPVGTAVCLADTGLNETQQIALECAASSGGEPITFASCTGGRLALKEFIDCKNVSFAEGRCFGENNEIRRFVRALGLPDIGPNSVVGKAANVHLDVVKFQVRFAEDAFEFAGDALSAGGAALENVGKGLESLGKETERVAQRVGNELERGVRRFKKIFGL